MEIFAIALLKVKKHYRLYPSLMRILFCVEKAWRKLIAQNYQSSNLSKKQQFIFVDNPRATFIKIINKISKNDNKKGRISPTAIVSATACIGSNCYIGNNVVIGEDCKIGNDTVISDRAVIVQKCIIGNNCVIEPGVTIGADGFA